MQICCENVLDRVASLPHIVTNGKCFIIAKVKEFENKRLGVVFLCYLRLGYIWFRLARQGWDTVSLGPTGLGDWKN